MTVKTRTRTLTVEKFSDVKEGDFVRATKMSPNSKGKRYNVEGEVEIGIDGNLALDDLPLIQRIEDSFFTAMVFISGTRKASLPVLPTEPDTIIAVHKYGMETYEPPVMAVFEGELWKVLGDIISYSAYPEHSVPATFTPGDIVSWSKVRLVAEDEVHVM